jgi:hypothetical protein
MKKKSMAVIAVLLAYAGAANATLLIQDTFNTSNTGLNDDLGDRQTGSLATTTWGTNGLGTATISGNAFAINGVNGSGATALVSLDHSFTDAAITSGGGFSVSFAMKQHTTGPVVSFGLGLSDENRKQNNENYTYAHDQASTDWGFALYTDSAITGVYVDGSSVKSFARPTPGTFFNVRVDVTTADFNSDTTAIVDFYINDSLIDGDRSVTWDADGTNYLALSAMRGYNPDLVIDNFSVSAVPEPATGGMLLLGATAFLGLLRRKLHG